MKYVRETYPQIDKAYIQSGKLKYAIVDLPLESIHSAAFHGAEMVRCAGEQGKFWEMRDRLFANPGAINDAAAHAAAVGLDGKKFDACVSSGKFSGEIRNDMAQAQAIGIEGTPSFILGVLDSSGKLKPVRLLTGAQPFANFKAMIDAALSAQ